VAVSKRERDPYKPRGIQEYNSFMGGDLKDQKLQPYETERKKSTKWYTKRFRRLLIFRCTMPLCFTKPECEATNPSGFLTSNNNQTIKELFEVYGKALEPPCLRRPPRHQHLTTRHFLERISPSEKKAKPWQR
jgi:hypothetical protein